MSKKNETIVETPNVPAVTDLDSLFSQEELAEMLRLTGQAANFSMDKTPTLKVNKLGIKDQQGKMVPMGNFVLGQVTKQEGKNTILVDAGEDCGPNTIITVIKFGRKFSFFPDPSAGPVDKKQICQSQLLLYPGDIAVGDKLGHECAAKTCPHRQEGIDKKEKCSCQYIVFVEVGEEKKKAIMYFKGTSFLPFDEYTKSAGKYPLYCFPTKLETEQQVNGSNVYWIVTPVLDKEHPYQREVILGYGEVVKEIDENVRSFETQRKQLAANRNMEQRKQLPAGMTVLPADGSGNQAGNFGNTGTDDDAVVF